MAEGLQEYHGNCHCGLFKYTFKSTEIIKLPIQTCDCSVCSRKAALWIFPVADENFTITSDKGEEVLSTYQFGNKVATHYFCPKCGSVPYGRYKLDDGDEIGKLGINARTIQSPPLDLYTLNLKPVSGSSLPTTYVLPTIPQPPASFLESMKPDEKLYNASCHCGAVMYSVKTKPLEEQGITSCDCSLCQRNGELFIYPPLSSIYFHNNTPSSTTSPPTFPSSLTSYEFQSPLSLRAFCSTCGVSVLHQMLKEGLDVCPLNVRCFEGVGGLIGREGPNGESSKIKGGEVRDGKLRVKYYDGRNKGRDYIVT